MESSLSSRHSPQSVVCSSLCSLREGLRGESCERRDLKEGEGQEIKMEYMCHESRVGDYSGQDGSQQEWGAGNGGVNKSKV